MKQNFHQQSDEKRSASRHRVKGTLKVEDQVSGELIGHIVDISVDGFMMQSKHDIPVGSVMQMDIHLPHAVGDARHIEIGAECIWSNMPDSSSTCWCGFHIIDISDDDCATLQRLLNGNLTA